MTKVKKKKSKKRAKKRPASSLVNLGDLINEDQFSEFCVLISGKSVRELECEKYRWGVPTDIWESSSQLMEFCPLGKAPSSFFDPDAAEEVFDLPERVGALELVVGAVHLASRIEDYTGPAIARYLRLILEKSSECDQNQLQADPVVFQLLFAELPILIAIQFPQLAESEQFLSNGCSNMMTTVEQLLDGDGTPRANLIEESGWLLASWTRCLLYCETVGRDGLDLDCLTQYEHFVRQMIRLTGRKGKIVFGQDDVDLIPVIRAALSTYHDDEDAAIAYFVYESKKKSGAKAKSSKNHPSLNALPDPSSCSEWAELAMLQTEWLPKSPKLIVTFQNRRIQAELSTGHRLFAGEVHHHFLFDNEPSGPATDWEVVCWHSDQDADFLELQCELENGVTWQKQFLLARNDLFLLTADAILNSKAEQIRAETAWTLDEEIGFGLGKETRELFLTRNAKSQAAVMPISLPEWRSENRSSTLAVSDSKLNLVVEGNSKNLYSPLFIDLDPKRCRQPLTWRNLTVANQLEICPPSEAVAFRIQVGGQQWLVYRSLIESMNRTFLGQNLTVEFYVGTLDSDGTSSEILSID